MTDEQKEKLMRIADMLIGTLGTMSPDKADEQVADQVKAIYELLGYDVRTFVLENKAHIALRLCNEQDIAN